MQLNLFDLNSQDTEAGSFAELCRLLGVSSGPKWPDRFGAALSEWSKTVIKKPITTLSLFSGAGGLDIAFHDAGFQINSAVEIDKRFAATLQANAVKGGYLEGVEIFCQDIRKFHCPASKRIDFVIGGPPCQSFSAAGRRAAGVQGTQDERGTLFEEYTRLLKMLKPRGFLFENVYGITSAEKGKAWEDIKQGFQEAGYNISFRILDSADYGVPQHRERMFIVGTREGRFFFPAPTHGPDSPDQNPHLAAADAVEGAVVSEKERDAKVNGRFGPLLEQIPEGLNYSFFTEKMGHPQPIFAWRSKFSDFLYKADSKVPVRTLKAQGGQYTGPFHWDSRPFSVAELKRLQTIPDHYLICGSRQVAIHQIGNSVTPQLARVLALAILQEVFLVDLPSRLPLLGDEEVLGFRKRKRGLTAAYKSKAFTALSEEQHKKVKTGLLLERSERARINSQFAWKQPCQEGPLSVQTNLDAKRWTFRVDVGKAKLLSTQGAFEIVLKNHESREWAFGDRTVKLIGGSLEGDVYVGVWKAFEAELARQNMKADLVQLCEYYHTRPRFSCQMTLANGSNEYWKVLQKVVEGIGTREILTGKQIAQLWECKEQSVLGHMQWLKLLAYEARNNSTNPQIPQGSYLIPYMFPTLNPMSVQLRKSLVTDNE